MFLSKPSFVYTPNPTDRAPIHLHFALQIVNAALIGSRTVNFSKFDRNRLAICSSSAPELRILGVRRIEPMSGPPRVRSTNVEDPEARPVLAPAGNKARAVENEKSAVKPLKRAEKPAPEKKPASPTMGRLQRRDVPSALRLRDGRFSSASASCSSDASSTDSSQSRASSSGRSIAPARRKQCGSRTEKVLVDGSVEKNGSDCDIGLESRKRCAWVTHNTEPCYAAFHDEEWGVPIHDDKKLFELLSLSGALAELTWPAILSKRHLFREVFLDFDPIAVSKLSEKRITSPGSPASSLLSELKLRGILENARQLCKTINEFGSFNNYLWNFVNQKPIVSQFRYQRQVPAKTPKAEAMSKDLVRRGFRSVGPTVIYSFMQAAGVTNDHLVSCFRFQECVAAADQADEKKPEVVLNLGLEKGMSDFSFSK